MRLYVENAVQWNKQLVQSLNYVGGHWGKKVLTENCKELQCP
jgi:hypothetical protein